MFADDTYITTAHEEISTIECSLNSDLIAVHNWLKTDYSIRSSDVLNSLEWSNLEERRKRHLLVTMFKIFNNDCPTYLRERFHRTSEIHDYNLRSSNYDLQLPLPKTNFLKRSFSYRGAMACNQLSNETREMGDLTSFKLALS